jgi:hydrogenase 3 maturation protease
VQSLKTELKIRLKAAKRIAVLGIGSEFRADDAAGMIVAESLAKKSPWLKAFLGATAPENLTGEIKKYKPTHIIIIDTADIKEKPGTILLLKKEDVGAGVSFSTHKLPAKVLMDYFTQSLKCDIIFVGIQPKNLKFGGKVSREVKSSIKEVSCAISEAIQK